MRSKPARFAFKTICPVAIIAGVWWITSVLPGLQSSTPLFVYLGAVMVCLSLGGWIGGVVATAAAAFVVLRFPTGHVPPLGATAAGLERVGLFALISGLIIALHASRTTALRRLEEHRQRMTACLHASRSAVWDYNLLKRTFWWSASMEELLERHGDDFPDSYGRFFTLIHFDDQPVFNRAMTRTMGEGDDYDVEHRMVMPDGTARRFHTRGRLFFDRDGRAERIVGIMTTVDPAAADDFAGSVIHANTPV